MGMTEDITGEWGLNLQPLLPKDKTESSNPLISLSGNQPHAEADSRVPSRLFCTVNSALGHGGFVVSNRRCSLTYITQENTGVLGPLQICI